MSHNLTLSFDRSRSGRECPIRQTPTTLTGECRPFLQERWKVFDRYSGWCRETAFKYEPGVAIGSFKWKKINEELDEHLNLVRKALDEGATWSWI